MKKNMVAIFLACVLVFSLLAGCASPQEPAPTPAGDNQPTSAAPAEASGGQAEGGVEVKMWTFLNPTNDDGRARALRTIMDMYHEQTGNTLVVETHQWETLTPKFLAAHAAGNAPDIIWANINNIGEVLSIGALEPLDNLFVKDMSAEDLADLESPYFNLRGEDGLRYQVPMSINSTGIIYRADLFEAAGIEPGFDSWEELAAAAQKLTKDGVYGFGAAYALENVDNTPFTSILPTAEGDVITGNGEANWFNDTGRYALQLQKELIDTYQVMPNNALAIDSETLYAEFTAGKYAMITGGVTRFPTLKNSSTFDPDTIKFMPFPGVNGKPGQAMAAGWCVGVWNGSAHKEAAGQALQMLVSPEADKLWVMEGGQIPVRKSTLEDPDVKAFVEQPNNEQLVVGLEIMQSHTYIFPMNFVISGWKTDLSRAMQLHYVDGKTIDEALETTANEFNDRNVK